MRAWSFEGDTGRLPFPELVAGACARVGYWKLQLDMRASTIRFERPGMRIDLGSIGKGYAIDAAIAVLRSHGVTNALLHGGTSSVHAIGNDLDGAPWRISWNQPGEQARVFELHDRALSVSAVHGKSFRSGGREYGHVIDPRTGAPTHAAVSAVVTGPASVDCDALSTALLVNGPDWAPVLESRFPLYQAAAGAALDERLTTV
jgi:thiamine biosynthesis lipoprotein